MSVGEGQRGSFVIAFGWLNYKMKSDPQVPSSSRGKLDGRRPLPTFVLSGRCLPMVLSRLRKDQGRFCKLLSLSLRSRMMIKDRSGLSRKTLIIRLEMTLPRLSFWLPVDGIELVERVLPLPLSSRRSSDEEAT